MMRSFPGIEEDDDSPKVGLGGTETFEAFEASTNLAMSACGITRSFPGIEAEEDSPKVGPGMIGEAGLAFHA